jgi:cytosine deaminase
VPLEPSSMDHAPMTASWFPDRLPGAVWLRDARSPAVLLDAPPPGPPDSEGLVRFDMRLEAGRIAAVAPAGSAPDGIPFDGGQVWPGLVDAHVHLDKTEIWPRAANPSGTHAGAVEAVTADRVASWSEADIETRFRFGLACAFAHGTVAMRTHIDSFWPHARLGWGVFRRLRDEWSGRIALQAVSLCPVEFYAGEDGTCLADLVADAGGVLGMVCGSRVGPGEDLGPDFQAQLDRFFQLAEERGLALDLHVDETGEQGARGLRAIAETALRRGFRRPIQCGHTCSLAVQPEAYAAETIRLCREAGIAIVVLPMCNMYLQGRAPGRTPRWRGITLVHELAAAGVPVSYASDNCRDPFYAYGDYDMLEVYREAVRIAQLDHPWGAWPRAVCATPAAALGLEGTGTIHVGGPADLLLFRARSMTELLSRPQSDRVVLRAGRPSAATSPDWRELDALLGAGG